MFLNDAVILLLILLGMTALLLVLLHRTRFGSLLHERIADRPRRRLFLASVSFFLTFAIVRGMVYCIRHQIPPFHYVVMRGTHIHHLVFGILILLGVGYGWLCEFGTFRGCARMRAPASSRRYWSRRSVARNRQRPTTPAWASWYCRR
jgi:hypothetical protein